MKLYMHPGGTETQTRWDTFLFYEIVSSDAAGHTPFSLQTLDFTRTKETASWVIWSANNFDKAIWSKGSWLSIFQLRYSNIDAHFCLVKTVSSTNEAPKTI